MTKNTNIPKLRFSEFSKIWDMKNGNEVFDSISNKNHNSDLPILAISQEHGAIPRELIDYKISVTEKSVESYKVVEKGDFIISLRSFQGGIEYSEYLGICSPAYIILKPKIEINDYFYKYYLKTPRYITELNRKLEGIRDGKMISYSYFSDIKLPYPNVIEQTKIASFLTAVDDKLQALKKKKELLEQYKKGMMQQLFSQEIRFKKDDGTNYPDWEDRKLRNTIEMIVDNRGKTPPTVEEGIPLIEVNSIGNINIEYSKVSKFVTVETYNKWFRKYLKDGDILFSTVGNTAICSYYRGKNKACIAQNIVGLRFKNDYSLFMYYLLIEEKNNSKFKQIQMGAVQPSIKVSQMIDLFFEIPSFEEQIKIANFLSAIDDKIAHCQSEIDGLELWEKGLLQQMFC